MPTVIDGPLILNMEVDRAAELGDSFVLSNGTTVGIDHFDKAKLIMLIPYADW